MQVCVRTGAALEEKKNKNIERQRKGNISVVPIKFIIFLRKIKLRNLTS